MAAQHIIANHQNEIVRKAIRGLQQLREGKENVAQAFAAFDGLKDGDGSQAAHFDLMAVQCGITAGDYADANTAAKAFYDELNSVNGNVNVAAAEQLAGFLGV